MDETSTRSTAIADSFPQSRKAAWMAAFSFLTLKSRISVLRKNPANFLSRYWRGSILFC